MEDALCYTYPFLSLLSSLYHLFDPMIDAWCVRGEEVYIPNQWLIGLALALGLRFVIAVSYATPLNHNVD